MIDTVCPKCKAALEETEENSTKCKVCKMVISDHVWESKFGYEWVKELEELQNAKS
jgi:transcription initiation factor TFIIIB Brf1 subunit/transcription initiation factor TFIIB